jgi:Tol biopolymer transport system component/uncharacterized membrane protein
MDDNSTDKLPDSIKVTLGSSEYAVTAGSSVEISVTLSNQGTADDYFKINLLGIPSAWISYSGPPAVWIQAGSEEKVIFTFSPSGIDESIAGNYLARLQVFGQSAPEKVKKLEILLKILPAVKQKSTLTLRVEPAELKAMPGSQVKIQLTISNRSQEAEPLELSVQGVPTSWVSLATPVITVPGGVEKKVDLTVQIPTRPEIHSGYIPLKVSAISQTNSMIKEEAQVNLLIAAFESQGRVGVMLSSVQFSCAPGETLTIPITVVNHGLDNDTFRLGVEGIPVSWVSTATPLVPLAAGESKEISLLVRPAASSSSQAGRNKFFISVASQVAVDQVVKVDCLLTVAAYSQFTAVLEPKTIKTGELAEVRVKNDGNIQQVFTLSCQSENDQLIFEFLSPVSPAQPGIPVETQPHAPNAAGVAPSGVPTSLTIPAGGSAAFRFTARPQQRQLIGGPTSYLYSAMVRSQQKQSPPMPGQVTSSGLIPIWVLPLALFACIVIFLGAIILGRQSGAKAGSATQTYLAATAQGTALSQTAAAGTARAIEATQTFSAELAQAISTTQTAAASTALAAAATQTITAGTAQAADATQTSAVGTLQAVAATETIAAYQTSVATLQTPTFTPTFQPSLTPTATPTQPQLPRFGGVVLFVSDRDGNQEIYNMDDAGHKSRLTNNPAVDMQPAWSPDMQRVAFTTNRDGQNEIYLMKADGTNLVNLTNNPADDQYPAWSIDGQSIAFSTNRDGNYEVYVLNVNTLEAHNLTNNPANDTQPNWVKSSTFDPAGDSIVFTSNRDGNTEIYRMKIDDSNQVNLTQSPANESLAKGSPDGALIVFTTDRDGNQEVYSMRVDGSNLTNLTNNPASDFGPCWAPNQAWVTFTSERNGNREVYITKPNATDVYDLTKNPSQDIVSDWR